MKSVEEDILVGYKLGNVLVLLNASEQSIGNIGYEFSPVQSSDINGGDIQRLKHITEKEECSQCDIDFIGHLTSITCSKKCLLPYIDRQMNWIVVSILCASYLSSIVLMRSIFELLINVSTTQNGSMGTRIKGISFLDNDEKRAIKRTWDELCSWNHPYKKWLENMCPIYISNKPMYHPKYFEDCVNLLEKIQDLYLVISKEHFKMDIGVFHQQGKEVPIDLSDLPLFRRKIEGI